MRRRTPRPRDVRGEKKYLAKIYCITCLGYRGRDGRGNYVVLSADRRRLRCYVMVFLVFGDVLIYVMVSDGVLYWQCYMYYVIVKKYCAFSDY